jgi:predicted lipid-binding transport protein (Tim44 family)
LDENGFGLTLRGYNLFLDTMKSPWIAALLISLALGLTPFGADAKRLGGGKSTGMQRDMPARTSPDAAPAKPAAAPQQAAQPPAAAPGVPPKRSWMGPLAGLAAGLGLAALFSHFGLGEGMGSLLTMLLVAGVAFFVIRLLMRRFAPQPVADNTMARSPVQVAWPSPAQAPAPASAPVAATVTRAFVPAAFDSEGFGRTAKALFIRLQAANDSADLDDLRRFTTPEMFAELRLDLQERGTAAQRTDVVQVDAQVLDVADDGQRQIVSVRFHGKVVEEAGSAPTSFDEVWHLAKPLGDESRAWAIAGIEQQPLAKA